MDLADCVTSVLNLNSICSKSFRSIRVKPPHLQSSPVFQKRALYCPRSRAGDRALCTRQHPPAPGGSSGSCPGTSCVGAAWSPAREPALFWGPSPREQHLPRVLQHRLQRSILEACSDPTPAAAVLLLLPWLLPLLPAFPSGAHALEQGGLSPNSPELALHPLVLREEKTNGGFCETIAEMFILACSDLLLHSHKKLSEFPG